MVRGLEFGVLAPFGDVKPQRMFRCRRRSPKRRRLPKPLASAIFSLYLSLEILFRILFACLCRLADFLAYLLPLVRLVFFDGVEKSLTLIFCKLCIMHIFVPMLLHTAFCSAWKRLCDIRPTIARIPHSFQSLFFSRCPRCIRSTLLRWWAHGRRSHAGFFCSPRRSRCTR